jgi:hypothetical protein
VVSRLINMLFGRSLRQTWLARGATGSLAAGLAVLLLTSPSISRARSALPYCSASVPG